jgi:hypothetical protein
MPTQEVKAIETLEQYVPSYIVTLSEEEAAKAYSALSQMSKDVDSERSRLLKPAMDVVAEVRLRYRPIDDRITFIKGELKKHLLAFNEARKATLDDKPEEVVIKYKTLKRVEIVNIKAIPKKFFVIDKAAIKEALLNGEHVKGARIIEEQIVSN